jgi:hypothetical protein
MMILTMAPAVFTISSNLTFTVAEKTAKAGDIVEIPIFITNNTDGLVAFSVRITFDSTRLMWQNNLGTYNPSNPLTHPWIIGDMPLAVDIPPADITENSVLLHFMQAASGGMAKQDGLLITLKLQARANAPVDDADITMNFTTDIRTFFGGYLNKDQYNNVPGKVVIGGPSCPGCGTFPLCENCAVCYKLLCQCDCDPMTVLKIEVEDKGRLEYNVDTQFDVTGFNIRVHRLNGTSAVIPATMDMVRGFVSTAPDEIDVYFEYNNVKSETFKVTIRTLQRGNAAGTNVTSIVLFREGGPETFDMISTAQAIWRVNGQSGLTANMLKNAVRIEFVMPQWTRAMSFYMTSPTADWHSNEIASRPYINGRYTHTFTANQRSWFGETDGEGLGGVVIGVGDPWRSAPWSTFNPTLVELFYYELFDCFICGELPCECFDEEVDAAKAPVTAVVDSLEVLMMDAGTEFAARTYVQGIVNALNFNDVRAEIATTGAGFTEAQAGSATDPGTPGSYVFNVILRNHPYGGNETVIGPFTMDIKQVRIGSIILPHLDPDVISGTNNHLAAWTTDGDSGLTLDMLQNALSLEVARQATGNLAIVLLTGTTTRELGNTSHNANAFGTEAGGYERVFSNDDRAFFADDAVGSLRLNIGTNQAAAWDTVGASITRIELFYIIGPCPYCGEYPPECDECPKCNDPLCKCECDAVVIKVEAVKGDNVKLTYNVGEAFDVTGFEIKVTYNDDTDYTIPVTAYMVRGFVNTTPDVIDVYFEYQGIKSETFKVTIVGGGFDMCDFCKEVQAALPGGPTKTRCLRGDVMGNGDLYDGNQVMLLRQFQAFWAVNVCEYAADVRGEGDPYDGNHVMLLRQYQAFWVEATAIIDGLNGITAP